MTGNSKFSISVDEDDKNVWSFLKAYFPDLDFCYDEYSDYNCIVIISLEKYYET